MSRFTGTGIQSGAVWRPDYVAELAAYVDEKMRLAARESPAGDTLKIAVLAALNIADEFFRACDDVETDQAALNRRAAALERMVDLALGLEQPQAAAR
jgi:cell division protein ZapA